MKKNTNYIPRPEYKGGPKALQKFISENLVYPEAAKTLKIEGTVSVRVFIDHHGKVIKTKIMKSLGKDFDQEAERVVSLLIFDVPKIHNLKLNFTKNINIHFNCITPITNNYQLVYTVEKDPSPKKVVTYVYTVDQK